MASFRIRKDFVNACSKGSPSASKVFWVGGVIAMSVSSEITHGVSAIHSKRRNGL